MQTLTGPRDEPLKSCPECNQYTNRLNREKWEDLLKIIEAWVKYYEDGDDVYGDAGLWCDSAEVYVWAEQMQRLSGRLEAVRVKRIDKRARGDL